MENTVITTEQDKMVFSSKVPAESIDNFISLRKEQNKHVLVLAEDLEDGSLEVTFKYKVATTKTYNRGGLYYKKEFLGWMA
jgi:hypothetical protein